MELPLTPQALGELFEKGYTYALVKTENTSEDSVRITLKPVREKPDLQQLPAGFETYYRLTQEPLQMVCGVDRTQIVIDIDPGNKPQARPEDILDDGIFRMNEDFFRQVLESLEDYAVFTTDQHGDVNSWNAGAEKILGYRESEIIGVNSARFFTEEDIRKGEHIKEIEHARTEGRAIDERYHVRKDGSRFWGSGLVFPLKDHNGKLHGFTKIMRNYRERKEAEEDSRN